MKFSFRDNFSIFQLLRELQNGLSKLSLADNFQSFTWEGTISANTEKKIRNALQTKDVYVIIETKGNALVTKGDTDYSSDFVYLKNHDASNEAVVFAQFIKK